MSWLGVSSLVLNRIWFILELDFFVNMKHIQKHRRARALNRLATRLDEDEAGFINVKCCHVIVYPLACSYLFNSEYTKYSDTIQVIK